MKTPLYAAGTLCLCALAVLFAYTAALGNQVTHTVAVLPATIDAAIVREAEATRAVLTNQTTAIAKMADSQITATRSDLLARVDGLQAAADKQITDTRRELVGQVVDTRRALIAEADKLIVPATAAVQDAKDSFDENYPDLKALGGSALVATTQTAQTLETVNKEAPVLTRSVTQISADFADATHNLDVKYFHPGPRTRKQKILGVLSNLQTILIAALRGGAL